MAEDGCARQKATHKHLEQKFQARKFLFKEPYVPTAVKRLAYLALPKRFAPLTYSWRPHNGYYKLPIS
ncbi:hypothetical protein YK48G_24700 [Lentilactobacillus fungorum]|uniref:Uncharacterized protein n=1 Tax=Lentilactobacillus fungorum TaxID=2201250 RepID=A0ABQ3W2K1_9LACO|nr:hypothetical protein YK48G_24700 [Lentilactobacillus fungorum]